MQRRPVIFVVISVLIVGLVYGSYGFTSGVFAVDRDSRFSISERCTTKPGDNKFQEKVTCCWREIPPGKILGETYCQTCERSKGTGALGNCTPKEKQVLPPTTGENIVPGDTGVLEQSPTPPPTGPAAPLQGGVEQQEQQEPPTPPTFAPGTSPGVLEQLEQQTPPPPPFVPGFLERQQLQPPADQGSPETPTGEEAKAPPFPTPTTGGCVSTIRTHCVPCDPGIPGASCTPSGEWPPVLSTEEGVLEQQTPPPSAPGASPGILEQLEQGEGVSPGFLERQQQLPAEQQQPPAEPQCPEGQILDEETGLCVLEEPEAAEEPAQPEPEEEQPPEE